MEEEETDPNRPDLYIYTTTLHLPFLSLSHIFFVRFSS